MRDELIAVLMLEGGFRDGSVYFNGTAKSTNRAKAEHKTKLLNSLRLPELSGSIIIPNIVRIHR
jgi:hypothetical protein